MTLADFWPLGFFGGAWLTLIVLFVIADYLGNE